MKKENTYIDREISWLSFNDRVLQEAADKRTPLIERIKFLGIFSSNLDEFFRVRVANLKRLITTGKKAKTAFDGDPKVINNIIQQIVINQQEVFDDIYCDILKELEKNKIHIINESQLSEGQEKFVLEYFHQKVRPVLFPIMIENLAHFPILKEKSIYLAAIMMKKATSPASKHAIIEVPTDSISRFLVLPPENSETYIILIDDIIRAGLKNIFSMFECKVFEAYEFKLTRDAEIEIDEDITTSFFEKISKGVKQRHKGQPVRFVYDEKIPADYLKLLLKKNNLSPTVDALLPGSRYHNFKDFMEFPSVGTPGLKYTPMPPLGHTDFVNQPSLINTIAQKDILLHYPYQSFHYFIDLLREASIDPKVTSIKITLYRVAKNSNVVHSLINAVRNGKSVTVIMELQARFDEEANLYWTNRLREEGARIIHGVPNLKVHAKLCLITRTEKTVPVNYAVISTGNFNEQTARVYSDMTLFTAHKGIVADVRKVFDFFEKNFKISTYSHLLVAPFYLRKKLISMINTEITNAKKGKEAYIILKLNSLVDRAMIDKLYNASAAGVKIKLIVRGICSLIPGVKGQSENITNISIVDRFLEHTRIFIFCNGGKENMFIASADWMTRNLDRRVEVACPIYDESIRKEIKDFLEIQFKDNTKAREITPLQDNHYKKRPENEPEHSAQADFYTYLTEKLSENFSVFEY